jgi:CheY-like chemotaxis protein
VIAVTASALGNEREDLRSAGCDSVILKPFDEGAIFAVLEEKLGLAIAYEDVPAGTAGATSSSADVRRSLEWATGMNAEMARLDQAIEAGDWESMRALAHDLRGASSVLGLRELAAAFTALEERAFARDSKDAMRDLLIGARTALDDALRLDR